jgi:hypothetical protein
VVPTAGHDGRDIERIVGDWGSGNFFRLLSRIQARLKEQRG